MNLSFRLLKYLNIRHQRAHAALYRKGCGSNLPRTIEMRCFRCFLCRTMEAKGFAYWSINASFRFKVSLKIRTDFFKENLIRPNGPLIAGEKTLLLIFFQSVLAPIIFFVKTGEWYH